MYVCICYYGGKTFQSDKNMLLYSETRVCSVYSTALMNLLSLPFFACLLAHTALKTSSGLNYMAQFIRSTKVSNALAY